jgi:hypothetical protein
MIAVWIKVASGLKRYLIIDDLWRFGRKPDNFYKIT